MLLFLFLFPDWTGRVLLLRCWDVVVVELDYFLIVVDVLHIFFSCWWWCFCSWFISSRVTTWIWSRARRLFCYATASFRGSGRCILPVLGCSISICSILFVIGSKERLLRSWFLFSEFIRIFIGLRPWAQDSFFVLSANLFHQLALLIWTLVANFQAWRLRVAGLCDWFRWWVLWFVRLCC